MSHKLLAIGKSEFSLFEKKFKQKKKTWQSEDGKGVL